MSPIYESRISDSLERIANSLEEIAECLKANR